MNAAMAPVDSPRRCSPSPSTSHATKRPLPVPEDPTEALAAHVKKCRVSSTPGELRLKRDLVECDLLLQEGVARFDKMAGNPLKCQLTFLCPIEGGMGGNPGQGAAPSSAAGDTPAIAAERRVPTTFSVVVPKFYPHDPPLVYAERCFSRTCSFVGEDGMLQLPFLTTGVWSSVSTMAFVARTLLQGLRDFVAGKPQPWGSPVGSSPNRNCHLRGEQGMPDPVAFVACSTADDNNESARTTPHFASSRSKSRNGEADATPGDAMWMGKEEALHEGGTRAPPRRNGGCFSSELRQQDDECGGAAMDVVDSR
ncbi:unnamed protein product [Ectocarpus fasciculatus]